MSKKVSMILRVILGLVLIIFGANKFGNFMPMPEMSGDAAEFMGVLGKAGYFEILGVLEIIIGLFLIFNKWVGLALVVLAPLAFNMLLYHFNYDMGGIGGAALVSILTIALFYGNWGRFKTLF